MKTKKFLIGVGLGSVLCCLSTKAAVFFNEFDPGQNSGSPYYADFTSTQLGVTYTYNSSTGTGTLNASSSAGANMAYQSGVLAAGTHNQDNKGFNGSYALMATVKDVGGAWQVTGGSLTVKGDLLGGTSSTVLLTANLRSGPNTINVASSHSFEFLFYATGGDPTILKDFFGTTDQGGIELNPGVYGIAYQDLSHAFSNSGLSGQADTFVPEPSNWAGISSAVALTGFVLAGRKNRRALAAD